MLKKVKSFLFQNQTVRQTVAKNAFWLTVSNFGGRLLRALVIIYAARILGASEWGIFSYAVSLAALLTIFTDLGLSPILTRETAKTTDESGKSKILSTAFFLKILLMILGVIVVLFVAPRFTAIKDVEKILPIIAFVLVFDTMREFGFSITRAIERMELEAGLYLLTNVAIVFFGFLSLTLSPNVTSFTYAYAAGTGIGMVATFSILRGRFTRLFSDFDWQVAWRLFSSGWPFAISAVMGILMINTDILIIGYFSEADQVGFYSAAQRIVQVFYLMPSILATSVFPTFARLAGKDNTKFREALERMVTFVLGVAIPIAAGGIILGAPILSLLFGEEYGPAAPSFQALILTLVVNFPAVILSNALFAFNKQRFLVVFGAIGGGLNVALDILFIPVFGIVGSAWSTFLGQAISNAYLWKKMKETNYFAVMPRLKNIVAATLVMVLTAWLLAAVGANLILNIGASAVLYIVMLYLLKEPLITEFRFMLRSAA